MVHVANVVSIFRWERDGQTDIQSQTVSNECTIQRVHSWPVFMC